MGDRGLVTRFVTYHRRPPLYHFLELLFRTKKIIPKNVGHHFFSAAALWRPTNIYSVDVESVEFSRNDGPGCCIFVIATDSGVVTGQGSGDARLIPNTVGVPDPIAGAG
jgi:hypothetical protein